MAAAGCGTQTVDAVSAAPSPKPSATACILPGSSNEPNRHASVRQLSEAAHAVVEGTVTAKGPGPQAGHDRPLLYTVRTEAILAGADVPAEWAYVAGPFREDGCEVSYDGQGVLAVDDRAVFFVAPPDDLGLYRQLLASQARYALEGEQVRRTRRDDPLARQVEAGGAARLRSEARESGKGRPAR